MGEAKFDITLDPKRKLGVLSNFVFNGGNLPVAEREMFDQGVLKPEWHTYHDLRYRRGYAGLRVYAIHPNQDDGDFVYACISREAGVLKKEEMVEMTVAPGEAKEIILGGLKIRVNHEIDN